MTVPQWLDLVGWLIYAGGIALTLQWLEKNNAQFPTFWALVVADNYLARWTAAFLWYLFWPSVVWYRLRRDPV